MQDRAFSRVTANAVATIWYERGTIEGTVKNLSLHGLLVETADGEALAIGQEVEVSLQSVSMPQWPALYCYGEIVRKKAGEIAIDFLGMSNGDLNQLRRLLEASSEQPDTIEEELRRYVNGCGGA